MTDHPCNCSTCTNKEVNPNDDSFCKVSNKELSFIEMDFTKVCGCLSHPHAQEYLMNDVIEELERRLLISYCGDVKYQAILADIINLIESGCVKG